MNTNHFYRLACAVFLSLGFTVCAVPEIRASAPLEVTPQVSGENIPVRAVVSISKDASIAMHGPGGAKVPGQIVAEPDGKTAIYWILPKAEAGKAQKWNGVLSEEAPGADKVFSFAAKEGAHLDLSFDGKPVTRLQYGKEPEPAGGAKHEIWKVYNKVFDKSGKNFITKGAGGKFPHHRGIYLGWSRTGFDGGKHDTWHMTGPYQELTKITGKVAGPVLGRYTAHIEWKTREGKVILSEARTISVYRQPDPVLLLLDLDTKLTAPNGDVELAGDPEHAGCQYRPHNDVAINKSAKSLLSKQGVDKGNVNKTPDLPWAALTYEMGSKKERYEVQHMCHPSIPKGNVYSAYRDYGRFGAYFRTKMSKGEMLPLKYRFRVAQGSLASREDYAARYEAYIHAAKIKVVVPTE